MFSVYISYRRLKPRPQFSSCAASACTCPRTSWPAGVWETSRITSAHTCLIRASCSTRYTGKSPSSSTCLSLQKQIDVLISIFFSPLEIWTCAWIFPFRHPFFLVTYLFPPPSGLWLIEFPNLIFPLSSHSHYPLPFLCHHFCWLLFFSPCSFPPPHSSIFVYLNLHEHWFWVVGCSLGATLSTAPVIEGTL